jgi:hypothetical protein
MVASPVLHGRGSVDIQLALRNTLLTDARHRATLRSALPHAGGVSMPQFTEIMSSASESASAIALMQVSNFRFCASLNCPAICSASVIGLLLHVSAALNVVSCPYKGIGAVEVRHCVPMIQRGM